ncbi:hypothetical protein AK812_SmicGene31300 [Symbiodinium microadriaticum]|uniref:Uncharacterized protein n=1 Tax=Symbiodinium microadriaticum TaxID=2951 RepID=A0A1Q9CX18_SYMMI|nr:hypothetical protein AK812_SmicGene31300 [Symbiodinium microadriaticum]
MVEPDTQFGRVPGLILRYAAQEKQREQDVKKLEENIRAATENGQEAAKQVQELAMSGTATVLCLLTSSNRGHKDPSQSSMDAAQILFVGAGGDLQAKRDARRAKHPQGKALNLVCLTTEGALNTTRKDGALRTGGDGHHGPGPGLGQQELSPDGDAEIKVLDRFQMNAVGRSLEYDFVAPSFRTD